MIASTDFKLFGSLDKLSNYEQLMIEICQLIQDVHMELTKTQYNTGTPCHSRLPVPGVNKILPTCSLKVTEISMEDVATTNNSVQRPHFQSARTQPNKQTIHKRTKKVDCDKEDIKQNDINKSIDDKEKKVLDKDDLLELPNDPLNWFGLLAPTSLQYAQNHIHKVIERCVELANVKLELKQNMDAYDSAILDDKLDTTLEDVITTPTTTIAVQNKS